MKKILLLIPLTTFFLSTPVTQAATGNIEKTVSSETDRAASKVPVFEGSSGRYAQYKTVVIFYSSLNQIPYYHYYTEYNNSYQVWMKGNLERIGLEQITPTRYKATFSGRITE